ncbi:zinc binding dehydrogenase, putative [Talaromyces stipitatus ATCC 10500]|uniref:Zinc binding dehydrogenase, putative n=1 Tax=Talaromyces stipitatus (strain ATCC 10500 / CBS 375.48 / QM 6759 / NRRL 1006) TaxID=441959 RepID=B8LTV8_TALSN|nr:zinc binding dehydrogenase, putative [Talaromyces stipitatus ATCC 10500]EED23788.1 zinc binding dehydrogenase, putative [Talaromyces stipitatus ATCC 10500]
MTTNMIEYTISGKPGPIKATRSIAPIPKPGANEVLIKVIATDSNPKDWKAFRNHEEGRGINQGDDISGIVESVGSSVWEFAPGDRVAAFHRMFQPHGSYAQYAIAPASTTFRLPANTSFEAGATLPLASMTAALALYQNLSLPLPWNPAKTETPILIYGGASAVGAYALKFAKFSGLSPIITVAGNGIDFVKSLNAADHIIDYRNGNVVEAIQAALEGRKLHHAFDAVSYNRSYENIVAVLQASRGGQIDMVDPPSDDSAIPNRDSWNWPEGIKFTRTFVSSAYGTPHKYRDETQAAEDHEFAYVFYRYISRLLAEEKLKPHPFEVLPKGLESVAEGIQLLYDRKVSAQKLVYRIADTPNLV